MAWQFIDTDVLQADWAPAASRPMPLANPPAPPALLAIMAALEPMASVAAAAALRKSKRVMSTVAQGSSGLRQAMPRMLHMLCSTSSHLNATP
jgi:hypothetical protein